MTAEFDPYHQWLGIAPEEQPPDHYRLLGVRLFESDPNVIENAADRQMAHLRTFQSGPHVETSQALLNEVARAKVCLLNVERKAAYDADLRQEAQPLEEVQDTEAVEQVDEVEEVEVAQAVPFHFDAPVETALPAGRRARARSGPAWRQPWVLAGGGGVLVLLVVILIVAVSGDDPPTADGGSGHSAKPPLRVSQNPGNGDAGDDSAGNGDGTAGQPIAPSTTVDLLKRIDPLRDGFKAAWRLEDGALIPPLAADSRIECHVELPAEYVVTVAAERLSGDDSFVVGLVYEGRQFVANLDGWGGETGGLQLVDDKYVPENGTVFYHRVLPQNKEVTLRFTLHKEGVRVEADGRTLVEWRGRAEQLSISPEWQVRNPAALFLGAAHSRFRITRWQVEPLAARE